MSRSLVLYIPNLSGGGAERMQINLSKELIKKGYSITFLVNQNDGDLHHLLPVGTRVVSLNARKLYTAIFPLYLFLRKEKPDVILCALYHCSLAAMIVKALFRTKTRVVISVRNTISVYSSSYKRLTTRAIPFLFKIFANYADHVVTVSKGVRDDWVKITGADKDKINVIYNPVVTEDFADRVNEKVDMSWKKGGDIPLIIGVGRLAPQKDFSTLIAAFAKVLKKRTAQLAILGKGPLQEELQAQIDALGIAEHVKLVGFVPNPLPYVKQSSLFVFSSIFEGLGNVLIEALACGTPSLSTDCPSGPSEILDGGKYGRLVPLRDPDAMAEAILKTLESPLPSDELQKWGQSFSAARAADLYDPLLR